MERTQNKTNVVTPRLEKYLKYVYRPRREDGAWAEQTGVMRAPVPHQLVCAHVTSLGISPVPVRDGEAHVSGQLPDLMLPVQQVHTVPWEEPRRPVGKVHIGPHIPRAAEQRVTGHVVMHPHKHIIRRHISKHRVGAVFHLLVGPGDHYIVPADRLLDQVQVRNKPGLLGPGQVQYVPPDGLSPLIAVHTKVSELTVCAVETHEVPCALASPVEENQWPLFPVVQSGEGVLRPVRPVRHLHILAGAPARGGSTGRAVPSPGRAALLCAQHFPGCTKTGKLLI